MIIEELRPADREAAAAIWVEAELTRPWNDPLADFDRALRTATATVLGARRSSPGSAGPDGDPGALVGTVMAGFDGHRGWLYYLAVAPAARGAGIGTRLVAVAEEWLQAAGAPKVELMVREANTEALGYYRHLGYEEEPVAVLSRWLGPR